MTLILSGTNGLSDVDGSAATPAIRGTDTNTGIFFPAADTIAFAEGGVESARLDSSGNLGLGVTPSAWRTSPADRALDIGSTTALYNQFGGSTILLNNAYRSEGNTIRYKVNGAAQGYWQDGGIHYWTTAPSGTAGNAISFTQAMTLDASGNLIVGGSTWYGRITSTNGALALVTNTASQRRLSFWSTANGDSENAYIQVQNDGATTNTGEMLFATKNSGGTLAERARIDSSGRLLVGTSSDTTAEKLIVIGTAATTDTAQIQNSNSSTFVNSVLTLGATRNTTNSTFNFLTCVTQGVAFRLHIRDSGNVVNQNNSYGAISDAKLKKNVTDATPKLDKLNQVRVVNYNLIGEEQKQIGVIAQELEQVFPGMIDETPDRDAEGNDLGTTTKSVKYSVFVPMLIKALQEQTEIIQTLTARVAALEGTQP